MQGASWWTSFIQACLQSVWGRPHCLINQRTAMSSLTTLHCLQVKDTERKLTDNFWPGFHKGIMQKGLIIISGYHVSFPSFNIYCFKLNQFALFFSLSLSLHKTDKISTASLLWFRSIFVLFAENTGLHFDDSLHVVQHHLTLGLSTCYKQNPNPHFNTIWLEDTYLNS